MDNGHNCYNLIVEIENPISENVAIKKEIDAVLIGAKKPQQKIETVANTIFPKVLCSYDAPREEFYRRFHAIYPNLRKIRKNMGGTYFGRLVSWKYEDRHHSFNQVENTIYKLIEAKSKPRPIKVRYEMSIYDPSLDKASYIGFPCMSFISLKIRGNFLDMTVLYRNQFFGSKAYGNYLGLGRLLEFISRSSGYEVGKLTCIATHANLEGYKRAFRRIIDNLD